MAQAFFRAAAKDAQAHKTRLALWEANAAIGLTPTFLEAIRLREQLVGQTLTEPPGSAIKDLVLQKILQGSDEPRPSGSGAVPEPRPSGSGSQPSTIPQREAGVQP